MKTSRFDPFNRIIRLLLVEKELLGIQSVLYIFVQHCDIFADRNAAIFNLLVISQNIVIFQFLRHTPIVSVENCVKWISPARPSFCAITILTGGISIFRISPSESTCRFSLTLTHSCYISRKYSEQTSCFGCALMSYLLSFRNLNNCF